MNLLLVGLGSMGKRRARLLQSLGGHTLAGADFSPARREEAEEMGLHCFAGLQDALAEEYFDAAFVCTAPLSHASLIDTLLDAGVPVFTELNLVADGYEELMAKAAAEKLTLFLSSTMLYRAETRAIAKRVTTHYRDVGRPLRYIYHIGQYLPDWHPWENYQDFFVGKARTGGVREILGIELPWLISAFGPVASASAEHSTLSALGLPYPDSCFATLHHKNGTQGLLAADVVSPKAVRHFEAFGDGLHLFWEGNPRSLSAFDPKSKTLQTIDTYTHFEHDERYSDNIVENAYLDEMLNFFAVLEGREAPLWSFRQDLEAIAVMDAIEKQQ